MMKNSIIQCMLACVTMWLSNIYGNEKIMEKSNTFVHQKTLPNGFTILVKPDATIPYVCEQLWFDVGSKYEKSGEKGIAHLIEHMIFKGTKVLSESDMKVLMHTLSGSTNAFTSYDYTGYLFNLPKHHWDELLPVMADIMANAAFKDDHLNSEMKAVIQELKMIRDNYTRQLMFDLISALFPDHPYHHPLIGYKQDLWNLHAEDLHAFYKKHYHPNNAALVIVGDVDPQDVFKKAEKHFAAIKPDPNYKKETFFHTPDIINRSITLSRDVQQPTGMVVFATPGIVERFDQQFDVIARILAGGRSSRLHRLLVDELKLVTSVAAFSVNLFDYAMFVIIYDPMSQEVISQIEQLIEQELSVIAKDGFTAEEVARALKKERMAYFALLENFEAQANAIGKYYTALRDPEWAFKFLEGAPAEIAEQLKDLTIQYLRPAIMNKGTVLPLHEEDKAPWVALQQESDAEDKSFLDARPRTSPIEPPVYALNVKAREPQPFAAPQPKIAELENGVKALTHASSRLPIVSIILDLYTKGHHEPEEFAGISNFVARMLFEGTAKHTGAALAQLLEDRGISYSAHAGVITMNMLAEDVEEALKLLREIVSECNFPEQEIEKVRAQLLVEEKSFWDDPGTFAGQLVKERVYKGHPYSCNTIGSEATLKKITKKDLQTYYARVMTPSRARIAVVGDIDHAQSVALVKKYFGDWKGAETKQIVYPKLEKIAPQEYCHPINRDQVTLIFAGLSVDRKHSDFDKLLIFDQIFGGGALGSMHSRLFKLREESGLFYTITGSLTRGAEEEPGMVMIRTLVSQDRLAEAEKKIKELADSVVDTITEEEVTEAKRAIVNSLVNLFASNASMASIFLYLDKHNLPANYIETRAVQLAPITVDQVKQAARNYLRTDKLITLKVGRVENKKEELKNVANVP